MVGRETNNQTNKDNNFCVNVIIPDVRIPLFSVIEFIAYLGWIKVAETLLNPWGDDDEDFQVNYLIDRNFQVTRRILLKLV